MVYGYVETSLYSSPLSAILNALFVGTFLPKVGSLNNLLTRDSGRKVKYHELLDAIQLTVIINLLEFHHAIHHMIVFMQSMIAEEIFHKWFMFISSCILFV